MTTPIIDEAIDQLKSGQQITPEIGQDSRGRSVTVGPVLTKAIPHLPATHATDVLASLARKKVVVKNSQIIEFNQFSNGEEIQKILALINE